MGRRDNSRGRQSKIEPISRYADRITCIAHLHRELGQAGLDPEKDLLPYQREILRDLERGLDEDAISETHSYWLYDLESLRRRGEKLRSFVGFDENREPLYAPARPRIDVILELTSKDNLKAEWFPRGWTQFGFSEDTQGKDCDWLRWRRREHRSGGFDSRPSNELLFVRGVSHACTSLRPEIDWRTPQQRTIDSILLQAARSLTDELKERLRSTFELRMVTGIFCEYEESLGDSPRDVEYRLLTWEISDVEERRAQEERNRLEHIEREFGFSLDELIEVVRRTTAKKSTGPAPRPDTRDARAAKVLRGMGHNIHAGQVRELLKLISEHRPELLGEQLTSLDDSKVVRFPAPE